MAMVPEGVFPRFLSDRGLDIRQPTIENQADVVARDVAEYLAAGGTITVVPIGVSAMYTRSGEYIAETGAWNSRPRDVSAISKRAYHRAGNYVGLAPPKPCKQCGVLRFSSDFRRRNPEHTPFEICKYCRRENKQCQA